MDVSIWMVPDTTKWVKESATLDVAPILSLPSDSMTFIVSLLDVRSISSLYQIGSREFWSLVRLSVNEAIQAPTCWSTSSSELDTRIFSCNPFPLLATLPRLRTVILHGIEWLPECGTPCPFAVLPPTVQRIEFYSGAKPMPFFPDSLLALDYSTAFPQLRTLRLTLRRFISENLTIKLPPTVTVLTLRNLMHPDTVMKYIKGTAASGLEDEKVDSVRGSLPGSNASPTLPSLAVLELHYPEIVNPPSYEDLPASLVHLHWGSYTHFWEHLDAKCEFNNYDAANDSFETATERNGASQSENSEPKIQTLRLRSVRFDKCTQYIYKWLMDCPASLTSIKFLQYTDSEDLPYPPLFPSLKSIKGFESAVNSEEWFRNDLVASGAMLSTLSWYSDTFPTELLNHRVFSSLTSLCIADEYPDTWDLPPGLTFLHRYLRVQLTLENVLSLPQGLLELRLEGYGCIEYGHVPYLPRSLRHLSFSPRNLENVGTSQWCPDGSFPDDGLPYEEITRTSNILFGLPPNLLTLQIDQETWDPKFGKFLPRSLRLLTGCGVLFPLDSSSTTTQPRTDSVEADSGPNGLTQHEYEQIREVIRLLPPGCLCATYFIFQLEDGQKKVSRNMSRISEYTGRSRPH